MSIINKRIQEWRWSMQQREVFGSEDLDELESHLKDEIHSLLRAGLTEEEAIWIAERRVGDGDKLVEEYRKVNVGVIWKQRIFWMLGGYFLLNLFLLLADIAQTAYLFWIPWGTVSFPGVGANIRIPIIPGILGILLFGIIYLKLTKKSSQLGYVLRLVHVNRRWKAFSIVSLAAVLQVMMNAFWLWITVFIRKTSPQLLGQISVANNLFALVFKLLIALIFLRLSIWFLLEKKEREPQSE